MQKINHYKDVFTIWATYKKGLRDYIFKKIKNKDIANELSHEVLLKVYNSCCSGKDIQNIQAWLFQIAHNTCMDYIRVQNKHQIIAKEYLLEEKTDNVYQKAIEFVEPLIKLLPEKYALPLRLADIQGQKQAQIAQQLGLTLSATKSRIQRARVLLKKQIQQCCHTETDHQGNLTAFGVKNTCKALQDYIKNQPNL